MSIQLLKHITLLAILLSYSTATTAQLPSDDYQNESIQARPITPSKWEQVTDGLDYTEAAKEKKEKKKEENNRRYGDLRSQQRSISIGQKLISNILIFILIIAALVGIALIIKNMLGIEIIPRNKKIKNASIGPLSLEAIEENIHESDLERFIRQALEEKNYALAIRLYYLAILKELSLAKAIRWKRDKTNRQYMLELQQSPLAPAFTEATRIFEWAWYGNHELSEADYHRLAPKFEAIVEEVKKHS